MAKQRLRLWLAASLLTLAVHYMWEMGQARFFDNMAGMPLSRHAAICFLASLGDVAIAASAYGVTGLLFRRPVWALRPRWLGPAALWVAIGLGVTALVERWAIASGRWAYGESMPTIFGVGLAPLLQWTFVPVVTLVIFRAWARRYGRTAGAASGGA